MIKRLSLPPAFDTPEEEDEFWQTHSPLDFEHEEVGIPEPRRFVRRHKARTYDLEDR